MEQILFLLVTLAGVTHAFFTAAETKCHATHNSSLCSVTLGGSVSIQVMNNASGYQLRCKKHLSSGRVNVFSLKKEKVNIQEAFRNRMEFFIHNGTLKITNVERNDSGQYSVEVFDSNGVIQQHIDITLEVKENIIPIVIIVCSAVTALLVVVLISCCVYCKMKRQKKAASSVNTFSMRFDFNELDHDHQ